VPVDARRRGVRDGRFRRSGGQLGPNIGVVMVVGQKVALRRSTPTCASTSQASWHPSPRRWCSPGPRVRLCGGSNFQRQWTRAIAAAGLDDRDVHFHDLRHIGNTLRAQSGATLADLMARMGHASMRAASIYLHTTSDRDRAVAAALDRFLPSQPSGT
jgi:integrase